MTILVREAAPEDCAAILGFIRDLADFEKALDQVEATEERLRQSLFGEGSVSRGLIAEQDGRVAGFAIWFFNYSTWQARKGLYLEDLYVDAASRGAGIGKALLRQLARLAVENECGRFEWSVIDWNEPAIRVYDAIGAKPQPEWIRYRLDGQALLDFAAL